MAEINSDIDRYRALLRKDPSSRIFAPLAEACRKAGLLAEALEIARTGVAQHPAYASGRVALARVHLSREEFEVAIEELDRALENAPDNSLAFRLLGQAKGQIGDRAGALDAYARALVMNPEDEEARLAVTEFGPTGEGGEGSLPDDLPGAQAEPAAMAPDVQAPPPAETPPVDNEREEQAPESVPPSAQTDTHLSADAGVNESLLELEAEFPESAHEALDPLQAREEEVRTDANSEQTRSEEGAGDDGFTWSEDPPQDTKTVSELDLDLRVMDDGARDGGAEESPPATDDLPIAETGEDLKMVEFPALPEGQESAAQEEQEQASAETPSGGVEALEIGGSSLAPEAREWELTGEFPEDSPDSADAEETTRETELEGSNFPGEANEGVEPLDAGSEAVADQYATQGYPDRARAIYTAILGGDPMNLRVKKKVLDLGPAVAPASVASPSGDREVRRKVEENIDTLNRWLANIRKGATG